MFGSSATCVGVQLADLCCYKFPLCSILLTPDRDFCGILCFTGNIQVMQEEEMRGRLLFEKVSLPRTPNPKNFRVDLLFSARIYKGCGSPSLRFCNSLFVSAGQAN